MNLLGKFFLLFVGFSFSYSAFSSELILNRNGKLVKKIDLKSNQVKPLSVVTRKFWEPHWKVEKTYRGISVNQLFDRVYGKGWKKFEEVLFTCTDGYQPSIPMSEFQRYSGYLLFEEIGGKFQIDKSYENKGLVNLGPYALFWDTNRNPELKKEEPAWWPYQVAKIDLVLFKDRFPKLAPKKSASKLIKEGFAHYRKYCTGCHSISGKGGGSSGVDLAGVYKRLGKTKLFSYIDHPRKVNPKSKMTRVNPDVRDRDALIHSIVAYLKTKQE